MEIFIHHGSICVKESIRIHIIVYIAVHTWVLVQLFHYFHIMIILEVFLFQIITLIV